MFRGGRTWWFWFGLTDADADCACLVSQTHGIRAKGKQEKIVNALLRRFGGGPVPVPVPVPYVSHGRDALGSAELS